MSHYNPLSSVLKSPRLNLKHERKETKTRLDSSLLRYYYYPSRYAIRIRWQSCPFPACFVSFFFFFLSSYVLRHLRKFQPQDRSNQHREASTKRWSRAMENRIIQRSGGGGVVEARRENGESTGENKDSFPFPSFVTRSPLLFSVVTFPLVSGIARNSIIKRGRWVPSLGPDGILIQFCLRKAASLPSFAEDTNCDF